jgi:hypothetical protein
MQLVFGFIVIFILSVIFSYFQGFIDFLINLGVFPEKYKNSANFDIMMIFVLYFLFMATAFAVFGIMFVYGSFLELNMNRRIKRAKKKALKEYGTTSVYFYFLDPKEFDHNNDKLNYVYFIYSDYLYQKYQDMVEVDKITRKLSEVEQLRLYHEGREYFGLPDIPKEYGIFDSYSDEALGQFQK